MTNEKRPWLERSIHPALPAITNEVLLFGLVILLAIATRFYMLEPRVMSHDESLHTARERLRGDLRKFAGE